MKDEGKEKTAGGKRKAEGKRAAAKISVILSGASPRAQSKDLANHANAAPQELRSVPNQRHCPSIRMEASRQDELRGPSTAFVPHSTQDDGVFVATRIPSVLSPISYLLSPIFSAFHLFSAFCLLPSAFCLLPSAASAKIWRVALVLPGSISDHGFNEVAFRGLQQIHDQLGAANCLLRTNAPRQLRARHPQLR